MLCSPLRFTMHVSIPKILRNSTINTKYQLNTEFPKRMWPQSSLYPGASQQILTSHETCGPLAINGKTHLFIHDWRPQRSLRRKRIRWQQKMLKERNGQCTCVLIRTQVICRFHSSWYSNMKLLISSVPPSFILPPAFSKHASLLSRFFLQILRERFLLPLSLHN